MYSHLEYIYMAGERALVPFSPALLVSYLLSQTITQTNNYTVIYKSIIS